MNSLTIRARLLLLVAGLVGLLALAVLSSLLREAGTNATLESLYNDRIVPLKQLAIVADGYAVGVVDSGFKLRDGAMSPEAAIAAVQKAQANIAKQWSAYKSTQLIQEEEALIAKAEPLMKTADAAANKLLGLVRDGDIDAVRQFTATEMYPAIDPLAQVLDALTDIQLRESEREHLANEAAFKAAIWRNGIILAVVLVLAIVISTRIVASITRPLAEAVEVAEAVAEGDLRRRIEVRGHDETAHLLGALSRMNAGLVSIVSRVRDCADSITAGSGEIANGSLDLSQRTEEQAASLEETAASMEELTSTVKQNSITADEATRMATSASEVAAKGGQVVQHVVTTMGQITEQSRKIADIIGVIDGIAFQTNILALNAAVEAARAGEQGRGFAVVAGEVRSLAQRSAEAAKEIKTLISASVERVEAGASQVEEAGRTMDDIVRQVAGVSQLISEISLASKEQSQGINQVSDAVMQMDQVTQQNAALVEESAAAAGSLKSQAETLSQTVAQFRL